VNDDEIRWACFLWSDHDWRNLQVMKRRDLVILFNFIKATKPWPAVRGEVTLCPDGGSPIRLVLDEIDVGNGEFNLLIALCERKNKARFLKSPQVKFARGVYNAVGSLMVAIRDPQGFALEDHVPMQDSGAGSSTLTKEPVIDVRADESETESVRSEDIRKGGAKQQKEEMRASLKAEKEARLARIADECVL
jgi:hypothetical protein